MYIKDGDSSPELGIRRTNPGFPLKARWIIPLLPENPLTGRSRLVKRKGGLWRGGDHEMGNTIFHPVNDYTRAAQIEGLSAEAS